MKLAAVALALTPALILTVLNGCSPSTDIGGVAVINALPETHITGSPPVLDQTEIVVEFFWTGNDPDGRVKGFQWKMSSNGPDGISVMDTLTVDPASGDTLNPWRFTTSTDSTFIVTADSSGFDGDEILPERLQRFFQPHTLFVRAVDEDGGVDPTPAMVTFTATTLAPTVRLFTPSSLGSGYSAARRLPPTFIMGWTGSDPDFETGVPTRVRYLLKQALLPRGPGSADDLWITTAYEYNQFKDELITFNDPDWSDWIPFAQEAEDRQTPFTLEESTADGAPIYYLFALQAQDTAGARSLDLSYAGTVHNFRIDNLQRPQLTIRETFLGEKNYTGVGGENVAAQDIAQNQPLEFSWTADASGYGGIITGYRYGWDVEDLTDDEDPGWAVQFGTTSANIEAPITSFDSGLHTLTVEVLDNSGQLTRGTVRLSVVPVPEPADQSPLLLIDDVLDQGSNLWPNRTGTQSLNEDRFRDQFWETVLSRVSGWSPTADVIDAETQQEWGYRDVVNYRTLLWTTARGSETYIRRTFNPTGSEAFVWLETYLSNVGNLFLAGSGSVNNFQYYLNGNVGNIWMYPVIYDTDDAPRTCSNQNRYLSFGTREDEDNNIIIRGREAIGYRSLGLAVTSLVIPQTFWLSSSTCGDGGFHTKRNCMGTKAVILDPDFKSQFVTNQTFPDTISIWTQIDYADLDVVGIPSPSANYTFGRDDEYYDTNPTSRPTNWAPQQREDGSAMVVPMWRAYTRYDWIADQHLANGDSDFPDGLNLTTICGAWSIDPATGRTYLDGVPMGVITYKTADSKPGGRADMIWGFDPYRMEHEEITNALYWALGDHFELDLN